VPDYQELLFNKSPGEKYSGGGESKERKLGFRFGVHVGSLNKDLTEKGWKAREWRTSINVGNGLSRQVSQGTGLREEGEKLRQIWGGGHGQNPT